MAKSEVTRETIGDVTDTPGQSVPARSTEQSRSPARVTPPVKSRARRWLVRLLRALVLIYIGVCIVFFAIQDGMIFPGRASQGQKSAVIRPSTDGTYELINLTTKSGDHTTAMFARAMDADSRTCPTVIFFYGNAMSLADCFGITKDMRQLGVNVLAVEYVGYGMSTGKASERTLYESADAAWDHLQSRTDIDKTKIIAAGWSLGGAVAIDLAARKPVIGLATFSAFTSMNGMGREVLPWLPTSLLLRHRFDSIGKIESIKCPIFLAHGSHDSIIPHEMRDELAKAAKSSPKVTSVDLDSNHNDVFERGEELFGPLKTFFDSVR